MNNYIVLTNIDCDGVKLSYGSFTSHAEAKDFSKKLKDKCQIMSLLSPSTFKAKSEFRDLDIGDIFKQVGFPEYTWVKLGNNAVCVSSCNVDSMKVGWRCSFADRTVVSNVGESRDLK
jgi:hypothetical protein